MEVDVAGKIIYNYGPSKNHGKLLENQMVRTINGDSFPFLVQWVLLTPSQWWDNQDNQAIELRWFSSELTIELVQRFPTFHDTRLKHLQLLRMMILGISYLNPRFCPRNCAFTMHSTTLASRRDPWWCSRPDGESKANLRKQQTA